MRLGSDPDFSLMPTHFPERVRPRLRAVGRFVRIAESLVDNPGLRRTQKLERLHALEAALGTDGLVLWSADATRAADGMRAAIAATGLSPEHARHILQALRRDACDHVCVSWSDLMVYCQFAAAPIGRAMLHLSGEDVARCGRPADALCAALRILRQLRDCEDPTIRFNRLCIPRQFLDDAMITPRHLRAPSAKGQTRAVLDRVLDGVERLLDDASPLPRLARHRGLRIHVAIVLCRAHKLVRRFRVRDPLRERVGLAAWQREPCRWLGWIRGTLRL